MHTHTLNGVLACSLLLGWMLACGGSQTTPPQAEAAAATHAPPPPAAPVTWRTVANWSGSGMKETESFTVASREWRVVWSSKAGDTPGLLQIYVYNDQDELVSLAANQMGAGKDVSHVRSGPGRHYLKINSANVTWAVVVEDQR